MKTKVAYDIGRMIASRLISSRLQKQPTAKQLKLRFGGSRTVTNRRRNLRKNAFNGIEVNRAEGGRKSNVFTGARRTLTVDYFGRIVLIKEQDGYSYRFQLAVEDYSNSYNYLDLTANLNLAPEFTQWRNVSLKYRVLSTSFSFNYTRVPESNDKLAKMLLWLDTDLAEVKAPLLEPTVMKLDMSKVGTKNYGVLINYRNTKPENVDWQNSNEDWKGMCILNIGSQDTPYLNTEINVQLLGTFKISMNILLILKDLAWSSGNTQLLSKTRFGGIKKFLPVVKEEDEEPPFPGLKRNISGRSSALNSKEGGSSDSDSKAEDELSFNKVPKMAQNRKKLLELEDKVSKMALKTDDDEEEGKIPKMVQIKKVSKMAQKK